MNDKMMFPGAYRVREDKAITTPLKLLQMLGWEVGDDLQYEMDFSSGAPILLVRKKERKNETGRLKKN